MQQFGVSRPFLSALKLIAFRKICKIGYIKEGDLYHTVTTIQHPKRALADHFLFDRIRHIFNTTY
jgi:hypothetical protein